LLLPPLYFPLVILLPLEPETPSDGFELYPLQKLRLK
jgi:hypothetical protein